MIHLTAYLGNACLPENLLCFDKDSDFHFGSRYLSIAVEPHRGFSSASPQPS